MTGVVGNIVVNSIVVTGDVLGSAVVTGPPVDSLEAARNPVYQIPV